MERFSGVKSSVIVSSSLSLSLCISSGPCPRAPRLSTHRDCKQVCFQLAVSEVSWPANADEKRRCCHWSLSRPCCAGFMGYQGLKGAVVGTSSGGGGGGMGSQNNVGETVFNWESRLPHSLQRLVWFSFASVRSNAAPVKVMTVHVCVFVCVRLLLRVCLYASKLWAVNL